MVMNIPLMSIDHCLIESNHKQFSYDNQPNQEVLKLEYKPDKLTPHAAGLYQITSVHTNGTITCDVMLSHITFTRILIPIAFPRENPIPNARKIHSRIHSRSQVDSRMYLSFS
jgi:hypothetical protein